MATKKRYLYKVYRDNEFVKVLPNVTSDFEYSQDINTSGAQITITLGVSFEDVGAEIVTITVTDEDGNDIVDENGNAILSDETYEFNDVPIDLANKIEVWLYYENQVNGIKVFSGLISSWKTSFTDNLIIVNAYSWGIKLDNHLISTQADEVVETYEVTTNTEYTINSVLKYSDFNSKVAQTFQLSSSYSVLAVRIPLRAGTGATSVSAKLSLVASTPTSAGTVLATVTRSITNTTTEDIEFTFTNPITLDATTTYHIQLEHLSPGSAYYLYPRYSTSGSYSNGSMYTWGGSTWAGTAYDMGFSIISTGAGEVIGANYSSVDPSTIVRGLLDTFQRVGGLISYTDSSIDDTGTTVTYNFIFDTLQDGINKALQLAPSRWYWYVDIGDNILHFHRISETADHTFVKGKHINKLDIEYTLDDLKNDGYFTGGDTGAGENLLIHRSKSYSIERYGTWLNKQSDNRVTRTDTAAILVNGVLTEKSNPTFRTVVSIPSSVYDIETISLGQTVTFRGFDNIINSLLLQIASITRTPDLVTLYLQTTPPTVAHRIEDIKRNLDSVITENNPSIAS